MQKNPHWPPCYGTGIDGPPYTKGMIWEMPISKMLLIMKMTAFLLLLAVFSANAKGYSQTVTWSGKNAKLTEIFSAIESQTDYNVFANKQFLKKAKRVTANVKNMQLHEFLLLVFSDQPIGFEINKNIITIKDAAVREEKEQAVNRLATEDPRIEIKGVIVASDGLPLAGATITVKGGTASAVSNSEGAFSINATPGQMLLVSYVGHQPTEVLVKDGSALRIVLEKSTVDIEQVVVTALGITKKKKALTYNVQEIKGDEINNVKDANFVNSLAGKVAGVTINSSSSGIGGGTRVIMRGAKSLKNLNNNALYVIDGVPLQNTLAGVTDGIFGGQSSSEGIADLNPDDIASISVLTGPSAAALYGSNAANGVVMITTKKAAAGKIKVNVSNNTDFLSPFVLPRFQNTYGSVPGEYHSWGSKLETASTYNPKDFFQTGTNVTNAINLSMGSATNQTYVSAASTNARGIIPNNEYNRYNFTVRNSSEGLDGRLSLDFSASYVKQEDQNMIAQGQYFNPLVPIYLFPRGDEIGKYKVYERYDAERKFKTQFWPYGDLGLQTQNPYWIVNRNLFGNNKDRYMLTASAKYKLSDWINVSARIRSDNTISVFERKYYASTAGLFASAAGHYSSQKATSKQLYADVLVNINKSFGDFAVSANIGSSFNDDKYDVAGFRGHLRQIPNLFAFANIDLTSRDSGPIQEGYHDQTQSVFASAQLSYKNWLYLDLTGRNDWSSMQSGSEEPSFFYPSVGLSTVLSDVLRMPEPVSFAKLRASYSVVGTPAGRWLTYPTFGYDASGSVSTISGKPIDKLYAEKTKSYEVGANLGFFRNRLTLDVTLYKSNTFNQLFFSQASRSSGFTGFYLQAGNIQNKGIEAALGYRFTTGKLLWQSNATFTLNRNKIVELVKDYPDPINGGFITLDSLPTAGMERLVTGGSIGDLYTTTGLRKDNQGDTWVHTDLGNIEVVDRITYVGSALPRYNIGFRNSVSYENFSLGFLIDARVGGVVISPTQALMDRFGVSETSAIARDNGGVQVGVGKLDPRAYYETVGGGFTGVLSNYVYSATNVRLREASLSYALPSKWFNNKISGLTLSVTGRNLFMFYNKAPFDPESTASTGTFYQGVDYFMPPSLRSLGFSVRASF